MEREFKYIITVSTKFTNNCGDCEISSSLERICNSYREAEKLLEDLYESAKEEREDRFGFHLSNPEWIIKDEKSLCKHSKLRIHRRGPYGCHWESIYEIGQDGSWNYLSTKGWID